MKIEISSVLHSYTGGKSVVEAEGDYLYAEFRTPILRFVDDVELYYPKGSSSIQVRSASRLGRRDFKANRNRVEQLRALIRSIR